MSWERIHEVGRSLMRVELFSLSGTSVTVPTVLTAVLVVLLGFLASRALRSALGRSLNRRGRDVAGRWISLSRLIHYVVIAITFAIAAETIGIKITTLFAAGAVFAIGIGFAMQNIAQNFVSGVILMAEGSIKPGDVLDVDGQIVRVINMGIRSTIARTQYDEELIVPNSALVQGTVKNFTLSDPIYRISIHVGVHYNSHMGQVREVLETVARAYSPRRTDRDPRVLLLDFGDSSVVWDVSVWIDRPWDARVLGSELREAIWNALAEAKITIAFPQLEVHFDPP